MHSATLQPAYLLHSRPYRESSLIVELYTQDLGRVAMVARGVRGKRSPLQPLLQPFRPLLVSWRGRGPLYSLQHAEPDGVMMSLAGTCLISGFYANELLVRLLHHEEPYPALYATYQLLLQQLGEGCAGVELQWLLRQFELRLLNELGYGLNLEYEAEQGVAIQPEQRYHYIPEQGAISWRGTDFPGVPVYGATLLGLACGEINTAQARAESKRLVRAILATLLGDKPLHSRELLRQMM